MKKLSKEEKELLLKDLCAKALYGIKVQYNNNIYNIDYISPIYEEVKLDTPDNYTVMVFEVKPYLRPMSSMTEEERKEYNDIVKNTIDFYDCPKSDNVCFLSVPIDWLNANKFDYRDLISKGLAIEVTKNNNPYK